MMKTINLIIHTNETIEGLNFNPTSGKPTNLNITIKYPNDTLTSNVTIKITERNRHYPFTLSQFGNNKSNVMNYMMNEVTTDSKGNARFTIIPTRGISKQKDKIGDYWIKINLITDSSFIDCRTNFFISPINNTIPIQYKNLLSPTPPTHNTPNKKNTQNTNNYIHNIYNKTQSQLNT